MVEFAEKLRNLQRACICAFLQEELRAAAAVSQESTTEPSVKQSVCNNNHRVRFTANCRNLILVDVKDRYRQREWQRTTHAGTWKQSLFTIQSKCRVWNKTPHKQLEDNANQSRPSLSTCKLFAKNYKYSERIKG